MLQATIFDIKRFALHDGPGLRTTLFFKGCPLRCWWCHNPESISPGIERFSEEQSLDGKKYTIEKTISQVYSLATIMAELKKELVFMDEGRGGVTFSGGEPLMQADFVFAALKECKKMGLHTAIDTSGHVSKKNILKVLAYTDLFLYDIKLLDADLHRKHTGVDNKLILDNLKLLIAENKEIILRIPLIPGVNNTPRFIKELLELIAPLKCANFKTIHLLPYHSFGESKYNKFNLKRPVELKVDNSKTDFDALLNLIEHNGFDVEIHGVN